MTSDERPYDDSDLAAGLNLLASAGQKHGDWEPVSLSTTSFRFAENIACALKAERERCAKVADAWAADGDWDPDCCRGIAAQIRDPESAEPQLQS